MELPANRSAESDRSACEMERPKDPQEATSQDPEVLRAALLREAGERRRAECRAQIQTEVVKLALDLLVREPDVEGFFGALTKTMVELGENHACGVWLVDDDHRRCDLWMAYIGERLYTPTSPDWTTLSLPREAMAEHLFACTDAWEQIIEYPATDTRLPDPVREFNVRAGIHS